MCIEKCECVCVIPDIQSCRNEIQKQLKSHFFFLFQNVLSLFVHMCISLPFTKIQLGFYFVQFLIIFVLVIHITGAAFLPFCCKLAVNVSEGLFVLEWDGSVTDILC